MTKGVLKKTVTLSLRIKAMSKSTLMLSISRLKTKYVLIVTLQQLGVLVCAGTLRDIMLRTETKINVIFSPPLVMIG
jgi:hypothetical protein